MSVVEEPKRAGLVARVQGILLHPKAEWDVIDAEPATIQGLFTGYACILAAIPAIAKMIGGFFPVCVFGVCIHFNPLYVIVGAIVDYILSLAGVFVMGLIIDALAPSFGGEKNQVQALKIAVYSMTAAWIAGIFFVLPALTPLAIVGLYSFYLLYLGLPKLTKAPVDKALVFTIVAVLLSGLVMAVAYSVGNAVTNIGRPMNGVTIGDAARITGPFAAVDHGRLEGAAKALGERSERGLPARI